MFVNVVEWRKSVQRTDGQMNGYFKYSLLLFVLHATQLFAVRKNYEAVARTDTRQPARDQKQHNRQQKLHMHPAAIY